MPTTWWLGVSVNRLLWCACMLWSAMVLLRDQLCQYACCKRLDSRTAVQRSCCHVAAAVAVACLPACVRVLSFPSHLSVEVGYSQAQADADDVMAMMQSWWPKPLITDRSAGGALCCGASVRRGGGLWSETCATYPYGVRGLSSEAVPTGIESLELVSVSFCTLPRHPHSCCLPGPPAGLSSSRQLQQHRTLTGPAWAAC